MNINKYTEKAQEAVLGAQQLADREGNPEITPEHLLLTLLEQREGIVPEIARKLNADPVALAAAVRAELAKLPRAHGGSQVSLSARLRQVTNAAEEEAQRLKDEYVSTEHLLVAIAAEGGRAASAKVLESRGITRDAILQALTTIRGSQRVTTQNPETTYQALERYGRDLTELARKGKLDPVIGRDDEIIPVGVRDGSRVRAAGEGESGAAGGANGDLYLRVSLIPHAMFERKGDDLHSHVAVPVTTAVLGGEAQVPTISGAVRLKIPETTQNGQVFRLKGHGMPAVGKPDDRGDLYATLDVQLPRSLTKEQREHYEGLRKEEGRS